MTKITEIEEKLYTATYGIPKIGNAEEIWNSIKSNNEILSEAIKVEKNKCGDRDILKGIAICEDMLLDFNGVDQKIYQQLINTIFSNQSIARLNLDGGNSFLLLALINHDLKLTEEQKQFAVSEAMSLIGTTKYKQEQQECSERLDQMGITDDKITYVNFGGSINPVGQKTGMLYMNSLLLSLSETQAHSNGAFDIRYEILRNPNWTLEEKQKLVYDFWEDDETYDEVLEEWEYGIINDPENYKGKLMPQLNIFELHDYTYNELLDFYGNKEITDRIWNEIIFCKQMHELRPQRWEIEYKPVEKVINK